MLVKELRGTESTQDACAKMRVKHKLRLVFVLLFAHLVGLYSENSNTASQHNHGLGIKGIYFYILSWVAQSAPPTPQNADCLFFFAAVICLLLSHLLVFYSNADSHSLLVPLFTSHTLVLSGCSVKRHFNIHDNPSPLVFRLTHLRAPHSFSEYLHAPSAVGKRSKNNDIIILMIVTITILLRSLPPNLHLSSPWIPTSEPSAGWSATEAGSAAFVSFFLSSSQVLPDPDKAELPQQPAVTKWWDPQQRGETDNSREIWEKKRCREPRTGTLLSTNNFNSLKFLAGKMAAWRVIKIWL